MVDLFIWYLIMEQLSQDLQIPTSPNQITLVDAISIDCIKTGSSVRLNSDLPRYMLRKIMLLDGSSRKLPNVDTQVVSSKNAKSTARSSWFKDDEEGESFHSMDIFLYLFLKSAPTFSQTIVTQLAKCQLSLPLITHDSDKDEVTLNCFAFQTLFLNRYVSGEDTRCFSVLEEPLPIISFIRVGQCEHSQKSEFLNFLLNVRHCYFSTRNSPGSTSRRFLLNGTVEVAWYIPKYKENVNINHHFVILNLRGDATLYSKQTSFIGEVSTIVYVFVPISILTPKMSSQLEEYHSKFKSKVIFLLYMTTECDLTDIPNILSDENLTIRLKKKNLSTDSTLIANSISNNLADKKSYLTLSQCIEVASSIGIRSDIELSYIETMQESVLSICKEFPQTIDNLSYPTPLADVKSNLLSLQGYFRNWSESNRELQLMGGSIGNVESYGDNNNPKKIQKEIRSKQLRQLKKPSYLLSGILDQCCKLKTDEINLFFKLLKDHLNEISRKFLPLLYDQYRQLLKNDSKQEETKSKLSGAADCITRSSLGIEHIFRELGQVYEAYRLSNDASLKFSVSSKLNYDPTLLSKVVARLIIQGHSLEIVNGDDNHVPITWVPDVLNKLSEIIGRDKKIFVVSVLGIQSSGKSTLLNAMFGIDFPVSSGRCTRGVFLQVIPIKQELTGQLGYDYVFLLDSEGLRAAELTGSLSYRRDNEMATFIVGLADLSIINIKGESNSEVQDILQIAIIAFIRMKVTYKKPICIFVHQNVADIQAKDNLRIARNKFIDTLNEMTVCAAQQENKELQFSRFDDVIRFNPEEDVLYFPGLFEGDPPMTSVSSGYVSKVQELREKILNPYQSIRFQILKEWSHKVLDIWNSVIKESFVFSYRNILEVNARVELDKSMCSWYSNFIQDMIPVKSDFISRLYNVECKSLRSTLNEIIQELNTKVSETKPQSDKIIDHFFILHEKKEIFVQWKKNSEQFFIDCRKKEEKRIRQDCEAIFKVIGQKQEIVEKFNTCRRQIVSEVHDLFVKYKVASDAPDSVGDKVAFDAPGSVDTLFSEYWEKWRPQFHNSEFLELSDISSDMQQVFLECSQLNQLDVFSSRQEYLFDNNIFKEVGRGDFDTISRSISAAQDECSYCKILDYHHKKITWVKFKQFLHLGRQRSEAELDDTQIKFTSIFTYQNETIDNFILNIHQDSNYDKSYFFMLIDKCVNLISGYNELEKKVNARQSIILTNYYIFDFTFFQCCKAIQNFEDLQETFFEKSNLEKKLSELESTLKKIFHALCAGIQSENLCATELATITLNGMSEHLKDTVLQSLHKLFIEDPEHGTIYSSRPSLQLSVLKELAKKKDFNTYISFINSPFTYIDNYILGNIREYSVKQSVVSNILAKINQCTDNFRAKCSEITKSAHSQDINTFKEWKLHYHKNIKQSVRGVKLSDLDILDVYTVENLKQFSDLFLQILNDSIKQFDWKDWIRRIFTNTELLAIKDNITNSLIGCKALCPFCKEPCQLSAGEHEHYCGTFHRPQGISGWRNHSSNIIVSQECTTNILEKRTFLYEAKSYKYEDYRTVNDYFNSWKILGQDSIDSKYWQWVLCTFQKEFVDYYKILPNKTIGKRWSHLTKEEVIDDIENLYHKNYFIDTKN